MDNGEEDAEDEVSTNTRDMTSTLLTPDRRLMGQPTTETSLVILLVPEMQALKN
jgi:hypothetical protein